MKTVPKIIGCICALLLLLLPRIAMSAAWTEMNSKTTNSLYAVWGSSADSIFAVGKFGTAVFYNGTSWSTMDSNTADSFNGIWGSSDANVFAVGRGGKIARYNGAKWADSATGLDTSLYDIWGNSDEEIFAVGENSVILFYDGDDWDEMVTFTDETLYGVWGSSAEDVFAVGEEGRILHYDGEAWDEWNSGTKSDLRDIWGSSDTNILAVGEDGIILHNDGSRWDEIESPTSKTLRSIWGSSAEDVFAVGEEGIIIHYNGSEWTMMESGVEELIYGVWVGAEAEAFAVGWNGLVLQYSAATTTTSISSSTTTSTVPAETSTTTSVPSTTTSVAESTTTTSTAEQTVDFVGSPTSGYRPLDVTFTSLSEGDIVDYHWEFGDNTETSGTAKPTHTYEDVGEYSVILTVAFADGTEKRAVKENYITVIPRYRCVFSHVLKDEAAIRALHSLRGSLSHNRNWQAIAGIYYEHSSEIISILDTNLRLKERLRELVQDNIRTVQELIIQQETVIAEQTIHMICDFFSDLTTEARPQLKDAVDYVVEALREGDMLDGLGVTVK